MSTAGGTIAGRRGYIDKTLYQSAEIVVYPCVGAKVHCFQGKMLEADNLCAAGTA